MECENFERSGTRKLSRLSGTVREIPDARNLDLDLTFYCPRCLHFTIFIEIKSQLVERDNWMMTRQLARLERCFAVLAVEKPETTNLYAYNADAAVYEEPMRDQSDADVLSYLAFLHGLHQC